MIEELEPRWPHDEKWQKIELDDSGLLPKHIHLFEAREVWAIRAAIGARRPLVVQGEPGIGKSELARAAAEVLMRPLVVATVAARAEIRALEYRFNAAARAERAQLLALSGSADRVDGLSDRLFVTPGPLWWVFDWDGAEKQHTSAVAKGARPRPPKAEWNWKPKRGTALLIEGIDRAEPEFACSLLERLTEGEFVVPHTNDLVRLARGHQTPLIVITSDGERGLPSALTRRCLQLRLSLPEGNALVPWLMQRGQAHFGKRIASKIYERAAQILVDQRNAAASEESSEHLLHPGQAEYLDLLRAVLDLSGGNHELQEGILGEVGGYILKKQLGD